MLYFFLAILAFSVGCALIRLAILISNRIYRLKAVEMLATVRQNFKDGESQKHIIAVIRLILQCSGDTPESIGTTEEELAQLEKS